MHILIGQAAKKNLTPPFLSSKSHISSFSAISAQSWLCFPSKTRTFPNNPFLSKLIHKLVWISPQKIMIAVQKVYWRCRHPTSKITILVPWFLPWISQWLLPFNGFCHVIEPCIVPWVLPRISLWVLPCDGLCHMSEPSLVTWVLPCSWPLGRDPATKSDEFLEKLYCNFFYNGYGCIYAGMHRPDSISWYQLISVNIITIVEKTYPEP